MIRYNMNIGNSWFCLKAPVFYCPYLIAETLWFVMTTKETLPGQLLWTEHHKWYKSDNNIGIGPLLHWYHVIYSLNFKLQLCNFWYQSCLQITLDRAGSSVSLLKMLLTFKSLPDFVMVVSCLISYHLNVSFQPVHWPCGNTYMRNHLV